MIIRNENGALVPMSFSDSQRVYHSYVGPELDTGQQLWFIVLKARQVYSTTYFMNLAFVRTIEYPNTNSLIIAQDLDSAGNIFGMAKRFYDHLPLPKMRPSKTKEIHFPLPGGDSYFRVVSAGSMAKGRGTTQSVVVCSEVAFWPHAEVMTGLFQAMPDLPNTMWVLESTANGMQGNGEMFYEQWKLAVNGESKLQPIFIPWYIMPKYRALPALDAGDWDEEEKLLVEQFSKHGLDGTSLTWRRNTISTKLQGTVELFHQEYPSTPSEAFIASGLPAFDPMAILKQQRNICPPAFRGSMINGKFEKVPRGELRVWKEPQEGHVYFMGVDTSEALKGGDYSCAQIIDMTELEQVAVVHGLVQPWDMAKLIAEAGLWYNKAMINVEVKNTGHAVQDYLIRIHNYPHLHPWKGKPDQVSRSSSPKLWGWDTNVYSRPLLIEAGRRAINRGLLTIHDEGTLEEIQQFSRQDDGMYEASAGHDDRVLALLLALRSGEENYQGTLRSGYWSGELSEPDLHGIRVLDAADPSVMGRQRIHRLLQKQTRDKATKAVTDWMSL